MKNNKKRILIFMGPPGSGKGTQTDRLAEKLKLPVISPGELLRQEVKKGTAVGKRIGRVLAGGNFVDNHVVEALLDKRLASKEAGKGVILDGFPRNRAQISYLEDRFSGFDGKEYDARAVYIAISDREAEKRLSSRRVCFCGASYHLIANPPAKKGFCDVCGRRLVRRPDDRPSVIARRLKIFHRENDPLLKYFSKKKILIKINGERPIEKIQKDIIKKIA